MKKSFAIASLALMMSFSLISCKKNVTDAELQTSAQTTLAQYPNASVEVENGVIHLGGNFASEEDKQAALTALKTVKGVKDVHDMAKVEAPVETATLVDPAVQQKVADAVKDFPSVKVEVVNGELTLTGDVSATQARRIKESVDALKVGKVNYNYTVK